MKLIKQIINFNEFRWFFSLRNTYAKGYDFTEALKPIAGFSRRLRWQIHGVGIWQDQLDWIRLGQIWIPTTAGEIFTTISKNEI